VKYRPVIPKAVKNSLLAGVLFISGFLDFFVLYVFCTGALPEGRHMGLSLQKNCTIPDSFNIRKLIRKFLIDSKEFFW
jgi:hypothetical protein